MRQPLADPRNPVPLPTRLSFGTFTITSPTMSSLSAFIMRWRSQARSAKRRGIGARLTIFFVQYGPIRYGGRAKETAVLV